MEWCFCPYFFIDPSDGCLDDEVKFHPRGTDGNICAPRCSKGTCPKDVPFGAISIPQCILIDASGEFYCALVCYSNSSCGDSRASCKPLPGNIGVCTYNI